MKGFGVTLAIGVLASMVSALVITRVLADWAVGRNVGQEPPVDHRHRRRGQGADLADGA